MTRPSTSNVSAQPTIDSLMVRFLATRSDAAAAAVEHYESEVEPHEVAAGFRVDRGRPGSTPLPLSSWGTILLRPLSNRLPMVRSGLRSLRARVRHPDGGRPLPATRERPSPLAREIQSERTAPQRQSSLNCPASPACATGSRRTVPISRAWAAGLPGRSVTSIPPNVSARCPRQ